MAIKIFFTWWQKVCYGTNKDEYESKLVLQIFIFLKLV